MGASACVLLPSIVASAAVCTAAPQQRAEERPAPRAPAFAYAEPCAISISDIELRICTLRVSAPLHCASIICSSRASATNMTFVCRRVAAAAAVVAQLRINRGAFYPVNGMKRPGASSVRGYCCCVRNFIPHSAYSFQFQLRETPHQPRSPMTSVLMADAIGEMDGSCAVCTRSGLHTTSNFAPDNMLRNHYGSQLITSTWRACVREFV